jgi:protoheme IX farnesyltransferase
MVLLATFCGFFLADPAGARGEAALLAALAGVLLAAASSSVLNQVIEREPDGRMERTRDRPLPAGRLSAATATVWGAALGAGGVLLLARFANALTAALAASTLLAYLVVYTPLKRRTALNTVVGAIPGAMPPVLGWTAAAGRLESGALCLFAILFLWQLPHFLSIAWLYRDDYRRGGYRMLPFYDPDGTLTARQMVLHCAGLVMVSLVPYGIALAGGGYLTGSLFLGALFLAAALRFGRTRTEEAARSVLRASLVYLPVLLALLVLGR